MISDKRWNSNVGTIIALDIWTWNFSSATGTGRQSHRKGQDRTMKAKPTQTTNQRTVTCKCPTETDRTVEHAVIIPVGQGHLVQTGNSYLFYCTECYNRHSKASNNTLQTVGQDLTGKQSIVTGYRHQLAMTIAKKDTQTIHRLQRNGYNVILQGKTVVRMLSPFISNLNGLNKQFVAMGLKDRKVTIITRNANNEQTVTKGHLATVVADCQKARTGK